MKRDKANEIHSFEHSKEIVYFIVEIDSILSILMRILASRYNTQNFTQLNTSQIEILNAEFNVSFDGNSKYTN